MASLLSVFYCCWVSRRKPPALQVHINNESSKSDDYIPISMGTLGIPSVTSCPSLQSGPHDGKNLARSFSSANLSTLNQELLKLRSQRPRVKEMDAVNLFPSRDEIPASEPRPPSSPSLLWYTWYCVVLNMRYFDMDVVHFVHLSVYQSVSQSISNSDRPSITILIICTILFEFCEYTDHSIGQYISSPYLTSHHLIWTKSSLNTSSKLYQQTSLKMK